MGEQIHKNSSDIFKKMKDLKNKDQKYRETIIRLSKSRKSSTRAKNFLAWSGFLVSFLVASFLSIPSIVPTFLSSITSALFISAVISCALSFIYGCNRIVKGVLRRKNKNLSRMLKEKRQDLDALINEIDENKKSINNEIKLASFINSKNIIPKIASYLDEIVFINDFAEGLGSNLQPSSENMLEEVIGKMTVVIARKCKFSIEKEELENELYKAFSQYIDKISNDHTIKGGKPSFQIKHNFIHKYHIRKGEVHPTDISPSPSRSSSIKSLKQ